MYVPTDLQEGKMSRTTRLTLLPLGLSIITRCVIGQAVKNEYLSPLSALI